MQAQSNVAPQPVWVRYIENGMAIVRFTDNVTTSQVTHNGTTQTLYSYEEIEVEIPNMPNFVTYVTENASFYWEQALTQAKQDQVAALMQGYNATLDGGFTSSATGTPILYGWQQLDQLHLDMVQEGITQGTETFPVAYADIYGNEVLITSQAQLTQLDTDATNFSWTQIKQARTLTAQVMAATTISAVQAVVWSRG